jgi:hypothetical protein
MKDSPLETKFDDLQLPPALAWFSPPAHWFAGAGALVIETDPATDFWRKTHYGFEADNGHFLYAEVTGDFVLSTQARFHPAHQYDQAGLMVRISPECWIKTSVEYESPHEASKLGVVVTNLGYSDWSTQDFRAGENEIELRIRRSGSDYLVEFFDTAHGQWSQLRMTHLHAPPDAPVQCGLYACSPKEGGLRAEFSYLRIEAA